MAFPEEGPKLTRRSALAVAIVAIPGGLAGNRTKSGINRGDLVRIVAAPRPLANEHPWQRRYRELCQACVGQTCGVIYVDERGRPEVDVPKHIVTLFPPALACSISLESEWVTVV